MSAGPAPAPHPTRHRGVAASTGLCLVLGAAALLPGTGPRVDLLVAVAGCAGLAGLYALVILLSRERLRLSWVPGLLDVVGATAVATSAAALTLLASLQRTTRLGAPAVLLLLPAALGVVVVCVVVSTAVLTRTPHDLRQLALGVAATAALGAELLSLGHLLDLWGLLAVQAALRAVAVAALLLAVVVLRGPGPRELLREDAHVLVVRPAVITAVACAVVPLAHATRAPLATVVTAVVAVLVPTTKSLVVHGRTTSLNLSREQALTDDLTGLGNRRALVAHLAGLAGDEAVALALVDLDRFKAVNDSLGHDAGDELLRQVAGRLRSLARAEDVVVRQGGDEFALVLAGAGGRQAADRAREVVAALDETFVLHPRTRSSDAVESAPGRGHAVRIGSSVGVASRPDDAGGTEELLRAADAAMYRAKRAGGGVRAHGTPDPPVVRAPTAAAGTPWS